MNADQARTPPRERFAATVVPLDLEAAAASLAAESHQGQSGHRQIALYKSHHTTLALFVFESGGSMPEHTAEGLVIIQALKGRLWVRTPEGPQEVTEGRALVLAPGVPHDVRAEEASHMLLTVSLAPTA